MSKLLDGVGRVIARHLDKPVSGYEPFTPSDPDALRCSLAPGDVLLVEGNNRISGVIKYLTQSTWSHAALFVGPIAGRATDGRRAARSHRGQCRRRRRQRAAVEIRALSHPHLPAGRVDARRQRRRVRLRPGADRLRLRSEEHHRSHALSVAAAGAAALAPPPHRARFGRSDAADLLRADRGRVPRRALSDPAQGDAGRQPAGAPADHGDPAFLAVLPARFRHLALLQRRQADHRAGLRLQDVALGRSADGAGKRGAARRHRNVRSHSAAPPSGSAHCLPTARPAPRRC